MSYQLLSATPVPPSYLFSLCCIVTDMNEYNTMQKTFEDCGFADDCEYVVADNTNGNAFDAYQAIAGFIKQANGKYIIVVHQDVRCIDPKVQLIKCLDELSAMDEKWAVCGNAGAIGYHQFVHYINNAGKIITNANLPARVYSLDENFLVIKKESSMTVSADVKGFHLYGTDLCIIADFLGYNAYVIPFMVKHLSLGNLKDLEKHLHHFIDLYGRKIRSRYVETTATKFYLGNSVFKSRFYNLPFVFFFVKAKQRIKLLFKRMSTPNPHKKTVRYE